MEIGTWINLDDNAYNNLTLGCRNILSQAYATEEYYYRELPAGNYYLSADLIIDCPLRVKDNEEVNLNLNGYMLKVSNGEHTYQHGSSVLEVGSGGTFNIFDEYTSAAEDKYVHEVCDYGTDFSGSMVEITGGVITGTSAILGDIIHTIDVTDGGTFNMYGGTIAGNYTNYGGAIYVYEGGTANIFDGTEIKYNQADRGAAVESYGTLNICGGTISKNRAPVESSAVCVYGTTNIYGGTITEHESFRTVYVSGENAVLNMYGGTICENTSTQDGGGIYIENSGKCIISSTDSEHLVSINNNTAKHYGGGIYVENGELKIDGAIISGNVVTSEQETSIRDDKRSYSNGGGIYATNSKVTIKNAEISTNESWGINETDVLGIYLTSGGGGIAVRQSELIIGDNVKIKENFSNFYGGGIHAYYDSTVSFEGEGIEISENEAVEDGGGLSTISPHESSAGRTLYYDPAKIRIEENAEVSFSSNTASNGGGIDIHTGHYNYQENITITFVNNGTLNLTENKATGGSGGGLHVYGDSSFVNNGTVIATENTASVSGGGLNIYGSSYIENNGTITAKSNEAVVNGGGLQVYGGSPMINTGDITVDSNKCGEEGGGIYIANGSPMTTSGSITANKNESGANGGGIFVYGGSPITNTGEITITGNKAGVGQEKSPDEGIKIGNQTASGGGLFLWGGCELLNGGILTVSGNSANAEGGGIWMFQTGITNNNIITIEDNDAVNGGGYFASNGFGIINYGEVDVTGNKADVNGGGAYFMNGGYLRNYGEADITGNTAGENGGGAYLTNGGEILSVDNIEITGNNAVGTGGGIYDNGVIKLSDVVNIDENKGSCDNNNGTLSGGTNDNIYLTANNSISLLDGLSSGSHIGLDAQDEYDGRVVVLGSSSYEVNSNDDFFKHDGGDNLVANYEKSDDGDRSINLMSGSVDLFDPHICEAPVTPEGQDGWYPIYETEQGKFYVGGLDRELEEGDLIPPGYYYLASDITVYETIPILNDVHICMNGHDIVAQGVDKTTPATYPVFTVGVSSSEDKTDLDGTGGILNIYGHIKSSTPSYGQWIDEKYIITAEAPSGLYDTIGGGCITGGDGGIKILDGATVNMFGGTIAGNVATSEGGGVYVSEGGSLNIVEGAIMGNKATNGGGIYAEGEAGNTDVTLNGEYAFVENNIASEDGGGVYLADNATMVMNGDSDILDNQATDEGGGVYISDSAELKLQDGVISGNEATTAGGVYMGGTLDLSESPNISSNKDKDDTATDNTTQGRSNVYLPTDKIITISGDLESGSHVGVLSENASDKLVVAKSDGSHAITYADGHYIVSDDTSFAANRVGEANNDNDLEATINLISGAKENFVGHRCETEECEQDCDSVNAVYEWRPIITLYDLQHMLATDTADDNKTDAVIGYYLVYNMETISEIEIDSNINLCLNGFDIKYIGTGNTPVINVKNNGTLNLYDYKCAENRFGYWADSGYHIVKSESDVPQGVQYDVIEGGMITSAITSSGSGILVSGGGTLNMHGGTIAGNKRENGSGVRLETITSGTGATFNMSGGAILGNEATENGGGVFVGLSGEFTMRDDAVISNNKAKNGAGIYIEGTENSSEKATVSITDNATVSDNSADKNGGGIYAGENAELNVSQSGEISNNTAGGNGAGVYLEKDSSLTLQDNASITKNKADKLGGGVFGEADSKAEISGNAEITNNTAGVEGGGTVIYGELTASGYVKIKDNSVNGKDSNAVISSKAIKIGDAGLGDAEIGVTIFGGMIEGQSFDIVASENLQNDDINCFTSDNSDYEKQYIAGSGDSAINKINLKYVAKKVETSYDFGKLNEGGTSTETPTATPAPTETPIPSEIKKDPATPTITPTPSINPSEDLGEKCCECCFLCDKILSRFGGNDEECCFLCGAILKISGKGNHSCADCCGCPRFLGICICIWILIIAVAIVAAIVFYIIWKRRKKEEQTKVNQE